MLMVTVSKWQSQGSNPGRPHSGPPFAIHCIYQNAQSPGVREPGPVSPSEPPVPRAHASKCMACFSIMVFRTTGQVLETLKGIVGGPRAHGPCRSGIGTSSGSAEFHVRPQLSVNTVCAVSDSPVTLARTRPRFRPATLSVRRPPGPGLFLSDQ